MDIDFDAAQRMLRNEAEIHTNWFGERYREVFVGTVFSLAPFGKYYTPWACSNVIMDEFEKDQEYWDAQDAEAEKRGLYVISGEGDPCDILVGEIMGV